jgi:protein-tyrosine phosphatase
MFERILTVCTGNLCRSPMAEAWLRHRADGDRIQVSSAGLSALVGEPAPQHAVTLLQQKGLDLSGHRARQLEAAHVVAADLVLVMERWQKAEVERLCPPARGRTYLLAHWQDGAEIKDPYRGPPELFEEVFAKINVAVDSWLERIH